MFPAADSLLIKPLKSLCPERSIFFPSKSQTPDDPKLQTFIHTFVCLHRLFELDLDLTVAKAAKC